MFGLLIIGLLLAPILIPLVIIIVVKLVVGTTFLLVFLMKIGFDSLESSKTIRSYPLALYSVRLIKITGALVLAAIFVSISGSIVVPIFLHTYLNM